MLPDRNSVTMTVPFMRAYTELLVQTCHKREAFAMGGMAAFIPSRKDPKVNEEALTKVAADKKREAGDGFDGTWVAHPGPRSRRVGGVRQGPRRQAQPDRQETSPRSTSPPTCCSPPRRLRANITSVGLRTNVDVGIRYVESWLRGNGAAAIHNLMEDAATAEISRSQVWQWVHNDVKLADTGDVVTADLVRKTADDATAQIRDEVGAETYDSGRWKEARDIFEEVALADDFTTFLTLPAYDRLDESRGARIAPGLRMPCGSRASLIRRVSAITSGPSWAGSSALLSRPTPCSPVIVPPSAIASSMISPKASRPGARRPASPAS